MKNVRRMVSLFIAVVLLLSISPLKDSNWFLMNKANAATNVSNAAATVTYNGHLYALFNSPQSYSDAESACESKGGYLAVITSEAENNAIASMISKTNEAYWIGLRKDLFMFRYRWITGEPFSYENFAEGEPFRNDCKWFRICGETNKDGYIFHKGEWDGCIHNTAGFDGHNIPANGYICEWESAEKYNVIQNIGTDFSFVVPVNAISNAGEGVPANGAIVSVYLGTDIIAQSVVDNGFASFSKDDFDLSKGYDWDYIKNNATVSAHLMLDDGLELCSETVVPSGVWKGAKLSNTIDNNRSLLCDEPRKHYSLSVAYAGSETGRLGGSKKDINKYDKICEIMNQYASDLAQATNAHIVLDSYSIKPNPFPDDDSMYKEGSNENTSYDILIFENEVGPCANIYGIDDESCHIYLSFNHLNSKTLTHESGHYLLGLFDEYCYGKRYRYDTDGNGIVCEFDACGHDGTENEPHTDIKYSGYWDNGYVSRPSGAPLNFGLMEHQHDSLELSSPEDYNYLTESEKWLLHNLDANTILNQVSPDRYTLQYYMYGYSCEETMGNLLSEYANDAGYRTTFTHSYGSSNAEYWFAKADLIANAAQSMDEETILSSESENYYQSSIETSNQIETVTFSIFEGGLQANISQSNNSKIYVKDIAAQTVSHVSSNAVIFSATQFESNSYLLIVTEKRGGIYYKNTYSIQRLEPTHDEGFLFVSQTNDPVYLIRDTVSLMDGNKVPIGMNHTFASASNDFSGVIETSVGETAGINLNAIQWIKNNGEDISATVSSPYFGENDILHISCGFSGCGTYSLMAEPAVEETVSPISGLVVSSDNTVYDDQVDLTFTDANEDSFLYEVQYDTREYYQTTNELRFSDSFNASKQEMTINTGSMSEDYVFAIRVINRNGAKSDWVYAEHTVATKDSNADGIPDSWFHTYSQIEDVTGVADTDPDGDGMKNLQEYQNGTDPLNPDTDGDNVFDLVETIVGLDPLSSKTDGETNDYVAYYGTPDVCIDGSTLNYNETTNELSVLITNNTDSKAMRERIGLYVDDELIELSTVNIDAFSSVEYVFSMDYFTDGLRIVLDEDRITWDSDYSNNEISYCEAQSISFATDTIQIVKNKPTKIQINTIPEKATCIVDWSIETTDSITVDEFGTVTSNGLGRALLTATTIDGMTATCNVEIVSFEGAEFSLYDTELVDGELTIVGYIGNEVNAVIPTSNGNYPITSIERDAFCNNTTESILISENIESISQSAFDNLTKLKQIDVSSRNALFSSKDGILYSKDLTRLLKCPANYPNEAILANDVETINDGAFQACNGITDVYYGRYYKYWKQVSIGSNNTALSNATLHCLECDECTWSLNSTTTPATCIHEGTGLYICEVCEKEKTDEIAINPNNHIANMNQRVVKEATCDSDGVYENICPDCGAVVSVEKNTNRPAHKYGGWSEWKTKDDGDQIRSRSCSQCGHAQSQIIPAWPSNRIINLHEFMQIFFARIFSIFKIYIITTK